MHFIFYTICTVHILIIKDLLSGKYYKDKAVVMEQHNQRMKIKKEKAEKKPLLPPKYF